MPSAHRRRSSDSNQLAVRNPIYRGVIGVGLRLGNLDWGTDIPNYNVPDGRRKLHRALPFPLYWLDSAYARFLGDAAGSPEKEDRARSAFIRLIDGGNGENLGVYSLLKRGVRNIVVADAASDTDGTFSDICALAASVLRI